MNAQEVKSLGLQAITENGTEHEAIAHECFIAGWLKGFGWSLLPKKWLIKMAENDWQRIKFLFNPNKETKEKNEQCMSHS